LNAAFNYIIGAGFNTGSIVMPNLCLRLVNAVVIVGGAILGVGLADDTKSTPNPKPLNVLFIMSDDMRAECGCYGGLAKTPNIDALAAAGVRFDRAYCQFPLCNPSRSSMLTGRNPTTTGVLGNRTWFGDAHPNFVSLPKYFKQHDYISVGDGKIFHGGIDDTEAWTEGGVPRFLAGVDDAEKSAPGSIPSSDPDESRSLEKAPADQQKPDQQKSGQPSSEKGKSGEKKGAARNAAGPTRAQASDRIIVLPGDGANHGDSHVADRAIAYLRLFKEQKQTFFLGCGFVKPHSPPTAPQKFFDLYDVNKIPLPPNFASRPTVPEGFPALSIRPKNADLFIGRDASPEEARQVIRAYLAATSFVDDNVGRVIAELDKLGLRENTVIVFVSDHGYQLGERGKWSKAGSLFEQGARVPFIVVAPGAKGNGQPCRRIVEELNIYPTLCELCGLPRPRELEGRSLVSLLNDPKAKWDYPAYTIWSEDGKSIQGVSVRTDKWRYAEFEGGKEGAMLFNENDDPQELKNLADDPRYASVVADLSPHVKQYAARMTTK
jgi:iduronate 2-sulfatase